MFCGESIGSEDESLRLNLEAEWTDGSAAYWCHGPCLQAAAHSSTPLYILSLRRDEAVFGKAADRAVSDNPECIRCRRPVRRSRDQYEVFERMHWSCFHYEFEHFDGGGDPDEACADPSCPVRTFDTSPPPTWGEAGPSDPQ
jgi:hypothetical protein